MLACAFCFVSDCWFGGGVQKQKKKKKKKKKKKNNNNKQQERFPDLGKCLPGSWRKVVGVVH